MPAPATGGEERLSEAEVEVLEPLLDAATDEFVEVVEGEFATRDDLEELKAWIRTELDDVKAEVRRQSRRGLRRTVFGMAANVAMKFGPYAWQEMAPTFERLIQVIDGLRALRGP